MKSNNTKDVRFMQTSAYYSLLQQMLSLIAFIKLSKFKKI